MSKERIIAVCLVTQSELELLGSTFHRSYPVDETPFFGELLRAIDDADRVLWRERNHQRLHDYAVEVEAANRFCRMAIVTTKPVSCQS